MRRGVSPIVAVVLLTAIAIAVAVAYGIWLQSRVQSVTSGPAVKLLNAKAWIENGHLYVKLCLANEGGAIDKVVSVGIAGTNISVATNITVKPAQKIVEVIDLGVSPFNYTTVGLLEIETESGTVIRTSVTIEYRS